MPCCLSLALRLLYVCVGFIFFVFIKAAALRSILPRYSYAPVTTCGYLTTACVLFCFVSFLFLGRRRFFRLFCIIAVWRFLCMFSFRMVFFYLVTTGWVLTSANVRIQLVNHSFNQRKSFGHHRNTIRTWMIAQMYTCRRYQALT